MATHINLAEELAKHKLSRLVLNATETRGKVREWRAIHDAVQNILKIYRSHIVESQEIKLALAISPLLADTPWDLSYTQLRAVAQNFRANNKPDKPVPIKVGLVDTARKAQALQAIPNSRVEDSRTLHVGSTTEKVPTVTKGVHTGNFLKHMNNMVPVHIIPKPSPRKITNVTKHSPSNSPATIDKIDKIDVDDEPPRGNRLPATNLLFHRSIHGADGGAEVSMALPALQTAKKDEARGQLMYGKSKQVPDTEFSSGEEDHRVKSDKQHIGKRYRTLSDSSSEVVPKPSDAKSFQASGGILAAVPCDQCTKAGVEFECFTFPKIPGRPARRACSRCHKKKKGCSFNSCFTQVSKKKNGEPPSDTAENVVKDDFMRQMPSTVRVADHHTQESGPHSNHAKREPARADVTNRVTKVENMVNDLQDQVKVIQNKVVTMDSRIEDVFEGTKSMTRVMKRFETQSEQASRMLEKLVERVEQL